MPRYNKRLWRAAACIRHWMTVPRARPQPISLAGLPWAHLQKTARQFSLAQQRGFTLVAEGLLADLACQADCLQQDLSALAVRWRNESERPRLPTLADIYRGLLALEEEFEDVCCNVGSRGLSVRTPRIVLEGVDLGPFRLALEYHPYDPLPEYRVIALEPNPAGRDERVTHPHVCNDEMCAGEGHDSICAALEQGRLYDFFLIVTRVLQTYAVGKAFVELDEWGGTSCSDCGCQIDEGEEGLCYGCDATLCPDCRNYCSQCDEGQCSACMSECACCQAECCRNCLEACATCRQKACGTCRQDDVCKKCRNQGEPDDNNDVSDNCSAASTPAAVDDIAAPAQQAASAAV